MTCPPPSTIIVAWLMIVMRTGPARGRELVDRTRGLRQRDSREHRNSTDSKVLLHGLLAPFCYSIFMTITVRPAGSLPAVSVSVWPS